jgi:ZIP family zinc transporter
LNTVGLTTQTALGLLIPFLGTALGAATVFLFRNGLRPIVQKCFLGFASGVMIAASVWSLLIPAIEISERQSRLPAWFAAAAGFLAGVFFLLLLDNIIPHLHLGSDKPEGMRSQLGKSAMLILAVTLHNIPEGMAVSVVFAGASADSANMATTAAYALSIGIAVQNIPEGAVISMPLLGEGYRKRKAFLYGAASGVVEPIAAAAALALTGLVFAILPYILAFAAGAMIYVVVEELIPEAQSGEHANSGAICTALGFTLMMILDVSLG